MPDKKKSGSVKKASASKGASKNSRSGSQSSKRSQDNAPRIQKQTEGSQFLKQLAPFIVIVVAIFTAVCMYAGDGAGIVGGLIRKLLLGLSGGVAYVLPVVILIPVIRYTGDGRDGSVKKIVVVSVLYACAAMLFHIFGGGEAVYSPLTHWLTAINGRGGGVIGGFLGHLMLCAFGKAGALVLLFAIVFGLILYVFGISPKSLWLLIRYKIKIAKDDAAARRRQKAEEKRTAAEEAERYRLEHPEDDDDPEEKPVAKTSSKRGEIPSEPIRYKYRKKRRFSPDVPIDEDEPSSETAEEPAVSSDEIDERIFDEAMRRTRARRAAEAEREATETAAVAESAAAEQGETTATEDPSETVEIISPMAIEDAENTDEKGGRIDLEKIFVNPEDAELLDRLADAYLKGDASGVKYSTGDVTEDELTITRVGVGDAPEEPVEIPKKEYEFPPVSILTEDTEARDENIKEELHANAVKLVETLRSFNVKTKIENVSRGPTITRYELLPEAGIRVRSILNLVDDIALNLATTGVRIEAPIPGKPAVGIEVPNKNRATVHLRTLIEDEKFAGATSKLLCALGEDVGGESVFLDIAKMPHLLIAGATGMGKSVCLNSLIVSLLYNANPDEVKLILIDPKKVELNIYNGIPHLLVPVVSDPKKAAGSLSWAVSEMERRFGLIESVGVRDVNTYNKVTANDPAYEFLPYIVIIIDELADLMMTAPDDVEESVCRLMQKARAAGMHVIIGTQRPSVDVITGLIKANIPSRIAFTVASQVDSRTIIDRAGAESLIGRGDMLYLPVGASKPIRVQGAFVSESDVEEVVTYIKTANAANEVEYSSDVIEQIEKEAAKCGVGKKNGGGATAVTEGGGEDDPMLRQALELAVNSGKISTSLIQRRLSLGYGRAAKLIDRMEQLGYVSAPDGQKPREVLITKDQFMEMVLKNDENLVV